MVPRIRVLLVLALLGACVLSMPGPLEAQPELVIVKEAPESGDKSYHRPGCPVVRDGKGVLAIGRADAEARGYKAHRECDPAVASVAGAGVPGAPKAARPETVFVDPEGTHYHRKGCKKLTKDAKPVLLTAAGKRWPCTLCKPPIQPRKSEPVMPRWRG